MCSKKKDAFTLVELLVVIAIIGVLVALLLPAIQAAREAARRTECTNNIKQLALALHSYHDIMKAFPAGASIYTPGGDVPGAAALNQSWITRLLPFIEQGGIELSTAAHTSWTGASAGAGSDAAGTRLQAVLCPSDVKQALVEKYWPTNYVGCTGDDQRFSRATAGNSWDGQPQVLHKGLLRSSSWAYLSDVTDGTSNTMVISECKLGPPGRGLRISEDGAGGLLACLSGAPTGNVNAAYPRGWSWYAAKYVHSWGYTAMISPNDRVTAQANYDCVGENTGSEVGLGARSYHPGGVNVAMVDGSTRFVADSVDLVAWRAAATLMGGESQNLP